MSWSEFCPERREGENHQGRNKTDFTENTRKVHIRYSSTFLLQIRLWEEEKSDSNHGLSMLHNALFSTGLCDILIISFIVIFSLLLRYDVFLFLITIIATEITKGHR